MLVLVGTSMATPHPLVLRGIATTVFFLLLSLLVWRREHRR
jgi:hypothetical protein